MRCSNCGNELPQGVRFCPKCGTPLAPATAPFAGAQTTTSFGAQTPNAPAPQQFSGGGMVQQPRKSGCGKALAIVLVVLLLLAGAVGGLVYYGYRAVNDKLRSSEAYTIAVNALKENYTVAEKMGAIKETGFPLGSFTENADGTGNAAYHMSVTGTKTNGTYDVVMQRRERKWNLTMGLVTLSDGEVVNLRSPELDNTNDNSP
ncbi:MAG: cytochrome c oxidase assembly factor Coa1 family protein, partial [Pyrinomonadaceae bacterium]